VLVACGERPQVIEYKQGTYQGKPDQLPFAGAPWNGNKPIGKRQSRPAIRPRMSAVAKINHVAEERLARFSFSRPLSALITAFCVAVASPPRSHPQSTAGSGLGARARKRARARNR
jgi:hypothetical protein